MKIAITGGAGYVGSALIPFLIDKGCEVTVLDTFWFGDHLPKTGKELRKIKGDIRRYEDLTRAFRGADAILHLACVSNDPSFEMNPKLGREINLDCFDTIRQAVQESGAKKFIYASSSSVYGVSELSDVTEKAPCIPITDYSKFKLACEVKLKNFGVGKAEWTIIRPATVCGYAPRLRLDVVVNAMTGTALFEKKVIVHGGMQLRPNLNIKDMIRAYWLVLNTKTHEKTYNVGYENLTLNQIAKKVVKRVNPTPTLYTEQSKDERSYHVNSDFIKRDIGFSPEYTTDDAIDSLIQAKADGLIKSNYDIRFSNIKQMKELGL